MLPFDNKSEFQVVLDLPEGATLETSNAAAQAVAAYLRTVPEVVSTESYAGTAAPFNFNGLVRHYFMRRGANVADVQVNLLPKGERRRQSHAIAVAVRPAVDSIARAFGANAKIAEIPPGPPGALDPGGRGLRRRRQHPARGGERVKAVMVATPRRGGRGLDGGGTRGASASSAWTGCAPPRPASRWNRWPRCSRCRSRAPTPGWPACRRPARAWLIVPRLGLASRSGVEALLAVPVATPHGPTPLARFVTVDSTTRDPLRDAQEPPPRHLRHRRRRRHHRVAGVRHPRHEPRARHAPGERAPRSRATTPPRRRASTRPPSSGTASGRSPSRCSATSASPSPRCWC